MALFGALALVALFLRLFLLGDAPLNSDEAQQALAALNFARNQPNNFTGSPLLYTGNALVFFLFGATDFAARLIPALFGTLLVLLPALLRRDLGRNGALIASALLAFSPSLVFFSRNDNGAIIAVTCGLAALILAWRYCVDQNPRDLNLAAVSTALALLASREVWTIVVAFGVMILILRTRIALPKESKHDWRSAAILFACVFLGIGTTLLMHREGIGATFDLLGAWLDGLRPSLFFTDPLRLLVVYEPIAFFFGVAAMIKLAFLARADESSSVPLDALSIWFIVAFVLNSISADKTPTRVVTVVVPVALMAGWHLGTWLERARASTWVENLLSQELPIYALTIALAGFLFLVLAEFATRGSFIIADTVANATGVRNASGFIVILLVAAAIAVIAFLLATTLGWGRGRDVGLAIALTLLMLWTIRQSIMLNLPDHAALNPQQLLVARAPSPSVRDLVSDLRDASLWRSNDARTLTIVADDSFGAIIAWNLRDFRNLKFANRPGITSEAPALLLPTNAPAPASGWMSQTYVLETTRGASSNPNLLRWLLYRDVGAIDSTSITAWLPQPK